MIEFRRDPATGVGYFLEINGRIWGSIALPCTPAWISRPVCWPAIWTGSFPPANRDIASV